MRLFGLLLLGVLAFVVTFAWKFPAAGVLPHVNTHPVQISGVSGSVWHGSASRVVAQPEIEPITNVNWTFQPQALLKTAAGMRVSFDWLGGKGEADVARKLSGMVSISDALMRMPAKSLEQFLPLPVASFAGVINADIDSLELLNNKLHSTTGLVNWRNAEVSGAVNARLGNVTLEVTPDKNLHRGKLTNADGELEIDGDFQIDQKGDFVVDLKVKPTAATPPELAGMLGALGRRSSDGSYRRRNQGNISDFL